MQSIKLVAQAEFDKLAKRKAEIEATDLAKTMWIPRGMTLFFTVQLAVGYGALFHVPWLGWDLVEPVTYTLSQGGFIACMLFMMRASSLNSHDYGDFRDRAVSKRLDLSKWAEEEGGLISDDRVRLLTEELE